MRQHQGAIRTFLARLCQDKALADDLAQDCFMSAYKDLTALLAAHSPRSYLFKIAYRRYVDHVRKSARRRELSEGSYVAQAGDDMTSRLSTVPELGVTLDIERAMDALPDACRAVVMLSLGHGMSHSEVAAITGLPTGTVKSHVRRGKEKLQKYLHAYAR